MKTALIVFLFLASFSSYGSDKISCEVANPDNDYGVEVFGERAAFFDNDTWTMATLELGLESDPLTFYFESVNGAEDFTISLQDFFENETKTTGTISVKIGNKKKDFDLSCKKVKRLYNF